MNNAKLMSYAPKTREDFIVVIAICDFMPGEGQLFVPVEKGVNL